MLLISPVGRPSKMENASFVIVVILFRPSLSWKVARKTLCLGMECCSHACTVPALYLKEARFSSNAGRTLLNSMESSD